MALTVTTVHTKTLLNPSTGTEDKVYGADYVSVSSHDSQVTGTLPASDVTGLATVATSGLSSDLTNDAGFITSVGAPVQSVAGKTGVVTLVAGDVGLGNVTNDAQTKAEIVPNTAPSAGQILAGNAGGTAYAPVSMSGGASMDSTGAVTLSFSGKTTGDLTEGANLYFTDERAQDAVGLILVDGNTVNFTYNDGTPSITAEVITQMSITSDASGVKLSGDSASPGNSKYYGTNSSGTKGFHSIPAGTGDVIADDVSTTVQNIVAYNSTDGLHVTELTGTQGDVLYHNGTNWAKLAAGTSGHYLKTNGSGANPAWAAVSGGSSSPTFPGGIPLTGVSYPLVNGSNLATGNNDLYTVGSGQRAIVFSATCYNQSAGNITPTMQAKIGGTYYKLQGFGIVSTGTSAIVQSLGYVFEAGESISVNTTTNNGLNIYVCVVLFDDTCAVYSPKLTSLTGGNDTLYTCPTGKTAIILPAPLSIVGNLIGAGMYYNDSGGARTVTWYIVPNGQSVGVNYQISAANTVNNASRASQNIGGTIGAGDFVAVKSNAATATQWAWLSVMEI